MLEQLSALFDAGVQAKASRSCGSKRCEECETQFAAAAHNQKFCAPCRVITRRAWQKDRDQRRSEAAGRTRLGSDRDCQRCGQQFGVRQGLQKFCPSCKESSAKDYSKRYSEQLSESLGRISVGAGTSCRCCAVEFTTSVVNERYCSNKCRKRALLDRKARFHHARMASCPRYSVNTRIRTKIGRRLKGGKGGQSWEKLVGYTAAELARHLERQFPPGMSWDNRADWHIDHIVPLSSFKFESPDDPEFKAAWALTNLRPLPANDNIRKSDTRTHLL